MLTYPEINPIAFSIGPLKIHWYGVMYLVGFGSAWFLATIRANKANSGWTKNEVADLIFYAALGVVLGGRIGYMLFYNFSNLLHNPLSLFKVWEGGMSFHGGMLGVFLAMLIFAKRFHKRFFDVTDFIAPFVPLGLAVGRLGNFINGELWGRVTNLPWGMLYPDAGSFPRHPSQLYECLGEGLLLFLILWVYSSKPRPRMAVSGLFLVAYGVIRFSLEFFRQPDLQLGFVAWGWLTMGQLLSLPMIVVGLVLFYIVHQTDQRI